MRTHTSDRVYCDDLVSFGVDSIFQQAMAQGQTFSVSSGDAGVYQWSTDQFGSPGYIANSAGTVKIDLTHYGVSEPSTSPYVSGCSPRHDWNAM